MATDNACRHNRQREAFFVSAVIVFAFVFGSLVLFVWTPPERQAADGQIIGISAMQALGYGFVNPPSNAMLQDFMACKRMSITQAEVGPLNDLGPECQGGIPQAHRYLLAMIALGWRMFGVSWTVLKCMLVAAFVLTGVLAYCVFRLGMARPTALICTLLYLLHPLVTANLSSARDFSKAPFVLAVILLLGLLIARRSGPKRLLACAAMLGVVVGFGVGFRQDMFLYLFPSTIVLAFCPLAEHVNRRLPLRGGAIVIGGVLFVLAASPIFYSSMQETGTYDNLLLGWTQPCEQSLDLCPASYHPIGLFLDYFLASARHHFVTRSAGPPDTLWDYTAKQANEEAKHLWRGLMWTFPGDAITHAYAATLQILSLDHQHLGIMARDLREPMKRLQNLYAAPSKVISCLGALSAAIVLIVLAGRDIRAAALLFILLMYFTGSTGLQFVQRHFFHTLFIPFWVVGVACDSTCRLVLRKRPADDVPARPFRWIHCLGFTVTAVLVLVLPLWTARIWQEHAVGKLLPLYYNAVLEPLTLTREAPDAHGNVLMRVSGLAGSNEGLPMLPSDVSPYRTTPAELRTEYVVAELDSAQQPESLQVRYKAALPEFDFLGNWPVKLPEGSANKGGVARYFFPVFEWTLTGKGRLNTFLGILDTPGLTAVYRVKDPENYALLPNVLLPPEPSDFQRYQALKVLPPFLAAR